MYRYGLLVIVAALTAGVGAALAQNADTVDGFHAYGTPHANALLALNGSARLPGEVIADNSIPGSRLVPGAVTAGRLGNNSVTTDKISDGQVMSDDLAAGAVTQSKIANNSVTNTKIKNGTILGEDIGIPLLMGGNRDGYLIGCFNGSTSSSTSGITGFSTATSGNTRGVVGACNSPDGKGVYGISKSATGWYTYGVYGEAHSENGYGVYGYSPHPSGFTRGVCGYIESTGGRAVEGYAGACTGGGTGVYGQSNGPSGCGVSGHAQAISGTNYGVYGDTCSPSGRGVYGVSFASNNYGELGRSDCGALGCYADNGNHGELGTSWEGVYGGALSVNGTGVAGYASNGTSAWGIYGYSWTGCAGYFEGTVQVVGDFNVTGSKNFKIDHPLDPENMYLYHSCVESPERTNIYNGRVVLDQRGEAWVQLADWFEAVNCDFLYQLTPIGAPGPNLYIAQEIHDGCFGIAGGTPGMTVCWLVTGTRADPYALAHPFEVEVDKPEQERGSYLHPELYGMPDTMGVEWATKPEAMMEMYRDR